MHAADLLVHVDQASGKAGQTAVPAVRFRGHRHGAAQGVGEVHEARRHATSLGELIELLFGRLDLVAGVHLGVALLRGRGDVAADADQVAAQGQVVDRRAVVRRVRGGRRAVDQVGQIADAAQFLEGGVAAELFRQQYGLRELALADVVRDRLEQPLVERLVEVLRLQVVAQPFEGGVVVQKSAQQRLFSLDVGRDVRDRNVVGGTEVERWNESHGFTDSQRRTLEHRGRDTFVDLSTHDFCPVEKRRRDVRRIRKRRGKNPAPLRQNWTLVTR